MSIFKNQTDNDDLLASDLTVVYGAPRMSAPSEAEQRQRLVEFATTLDRVAAHNGGMSAMVVAADTGTEKKGLGRYLRGLVTAVVVLITTTAGVSTVAHNVWGTNVPIVVNVSIPALQQHTTAAPRPVYIYRPAPTAIIPPVVRAATIGLSSNSSFFSPAEDKNGDVRPYDAIADGAIREVTTVSIAHESIPGTTILLHTYIADFFDNKYGEEFKLNVGNLQRRGYHRLSFGYGCADGKDTTSNAQAQLTVTDNDTGSVVQDINQNKVDVQLSEGHSLGQVTLDLTAANAPHVLHFQTAPVGSAWESCAVALVNVTASK